MVQNKLDTAGNIKERPATSLFDKFGICDVFHLSVKEANNAQPNGKPYRDFEDFVDNLLTVVKDHVTKMARETHWDSAKNLLRQHKDENVWSRQELLGNLQLIDADINESSMMSYAYSLCSNGFIFFYPEIEELKNCIFINPAWVTETIYDILDDEVRENGGEFGRKKVETKAGKDHATAFIALMKKFELIFENPVNGKLIAPQYLPVQLIDPDKWSELKDRFNEFASPDFYIRFPDFMPRSIMLRFLAAYGDKAIGRSYWKGGIAFRLEKEDVAVLYDMENNGFRIFVKGGNKYVQRLVWDTLFQLSGNKDSLLLGLNTEDFVQYSELKKYYSNNEVATTSGKLIQCLPFRHFAEDRESLKKTSTINMDTNTKPIKIFISYAHEDEKIKEELEQTYLESIKLNLYSGLIVWTDKEIKPGTNWDNIIKNNMETADIVLFLISNSFVSSKYIKETEIIKATERYKAGEQIIVPIYVQKVNEELLPFSEKQFLPDGTPLKKYKDRNDAWLKIQKGLMKIIKDIKAGEKQEYFK